MTNHIEQASNYVNVQFKSIGENAALARLLVAALISGRDLTVAELDEIKVAVSEAVSNAIIHGYENDSNRLVTMQVSIVDDLLTVVIADSGVGIEDVAQAMEANFSTDEERMGLGFSFMQSFMDTLEVQSTPQVGTTVIMTRKLTSEVPAQKVG